MRLRTFYEYSLMSVILLSLLAVLLGNGLPKWAWISLVMPASMIHLRQRKCILPGLWGTVLAILTVGISCFMILLQGLSAIVPGATLCLMALLIVRLLTRQNTDHDLQAILLSLLLLLAGSVLHTQITYGLVFIAYGVCVVWTLVSRQLLLQQSTQDTRLSRLSLAKMHLRAKFLASTAFMLLLVFAATSILFLLFPRIGLGNFGFLNQSTQALPTVVSLVEPPRGALGGQAALARIWGLTLSIFQQGLYLRGPVYDKLSSQGFTRSQIVGILPKPTVYLHSASKQIVRYEVFVQPISRDTVFALGNIQKAFMHSGGAANPSRINKIISNQADVNLEYRFLWSLEGPARYQVTGDIALPSDLTKNVSGSVDPTYIAPQIGNEIWLDVSEVAPQIKALAKHIVKGASSRLEKARRLRLYLKQNYTYALNYPFSSSQVDPLFAFLFGHKQGHCEYFSTAFAALLRAVDIPARVIGGLHAGRWDQRDQVVVFTQADAHAWVEWLDLERGWIVDDATPAIIERPQFLKGFAAWRESWQRRWDQYVVDYDLAKQWAMVQKLRDSFSGPTFRQLRSHAPILKTFIHTIIGLLILGMAGIGFYAYQKRRRKGRGQFKGAALARAIEKIIEQKQAKPVPKVQTLREAMQLMFEQGRASASRISNLEQLLLMGALETYEEISFGEKKVEPTRVKTFLYKLKKAGKQS